MGFEMWTRGTLTATILACSMALPLPSRGQTADLHAIAGVYKNRFENAFVSGETFQSEDILEIVELSPAKAYVRLSLHFFNGHTCSFWGVARTHGDRLVYRGGRSSKEGCELTLRAKEGALVLEDKEGICRASSCGARGYFDGIGFDLGKRRPIRYMDRLRASWQFKEALEEESARGE